MPASDQQNKDYEWKLNIRPSPHPRHRTQSPHPVTHVYNNKCVYYPFVSIKVIIIYQFAIFIYVYIYLHEQVGLVNKIKSNFYFKFEIYNYIIKQFTFQAEKKIFFF